MKLSIRHRTRYRYRHPVTLHPHRLPARPREGAELRVIDMDGEVSVSAIEDEAPRPAGDAIMKEHV